MNKPKQVGIGILGNGFIAEKHAQAAMQVEQGKLVAICGRNQENLQQFIDKYPCTPYTQLEEFLKNPAIDLVVVCVPTYLHQEQVIKIARAKKHILCEKPFALSSQACQAMISSAKKEGVYLTVAQTLRHWPAYEKIKELVDQGAIGKIKSVKAARLCQFPNWSPWYKDPEKSGGALFDLQIHDLDYIHYLCDSSVAYSSAVGVRDENECWNEVMSSFVLKNGAVASIHVTNQLGGDYPFTMSLLIRGELGTLEFTYTDGLNIGMAENGKRELILYNQGKTPISVDFSKEDGYLPQLVHVVDSIQAGVPSRKVPIEQSLEMIELVEKLKNDLEQTANGTW